MRIHMRILDVAVSTKKAVNLSVREELVTEAKRQGLNLSRVLEEALDEKLRAERARRWLDENRTAIAYHRRRIERGGLWHKGLTPWY